MRARIVAVGVLAALGVAAAVIVANDSLPANSAASPAKIFVDCTNCPEMALIPAGVFTMGSPRSEQYRGAETQHRVTISSPFALGKYEVTFDQWEACVADGGDTSSHDSVSWTNSVTPPTYTYAYRRQIPG